ncbi:P-loop containing nucleoside triphosphate hydrolase protein [Protomyces lactucae-debilis]|uniref:p-loop containing nucleoside triphosphate hydrolase protein n=1 Tax=Protomyces lactucae-debilis TaxID=2754530 RepID=A0A1Y2EU81_PROLT|nr:P-loop containing nucleoside triphosphate hydrolase protein [Protomyces lactucae-debilis]ORY75120.1 P-loop containing nucleoside triphosphate hydrolase protein [Protomyces lactucae-debilis]
MTLAVLAAIAAGVPLPVMSYITGDIIDSFGSNYDNIKNRIWVLILIAISFFAVSWTYMSLFSQIGMKNGVRLREAYVKALLYADVSNVEGRGAEIASKLGSSIHLVQSGTGDKAGLLIQSLSYFLSAFIVGFIRNPMLTAILIPAVPIFLIIVTVGSRLTARYNQRIDEKNLESTTFAQECFKNIRLLKTLNAQTVLSKRFADITTSSQRDTIKRAAVGALTTGCIYFVIFMTNGLAFWQGARLIVSQDQAGAGDTYVVVSLVIDSSFVVGMISPFLQIFGTAASAGEEIRHEAEQVQPINVASADGIHVSPDCDAHIQLQKVDFAYPSAPQTKVLRDFTFTIPAGKFVGIVGPSGSSKSTLVNLIQRFYDKTSGSILIDGVELTDLNLASLRKQMLLVSQEPVLFSGSIHDNIASGLLKYGPLPAPDTLRRLIQRAAEDAYAATFIEMLEEGYNTQVGANGGAKLSVGQRQRIALARALISNPRILLLDEATSAVDALSERYIAEALRRPNEGGKPRTTVCVAHRLSTIREADLILVMADGQVVESGTHSDLLARDGRYADMVALQSILPVEKEDVASESDLEISTPDSLAKEPLLMDDVPIIDDDNAAEEPTRSLLRDIYTHARPEQRWIVLGLCGSFFAGSITAADALLFGHLISALNAVNDPDFLRSRASFLAGFFVLIAGVALLAYFFMGFSFGVSSVRLTQRVKNRVFAQLLETPIEYYDDEDNSADRIASRIDTDTASLGGLSGQFIGTAFSVTTSILSGVILAHAVAWKIALVLFPAVPLIILAGYARLKVISHNQHRNETAFEDSAALASEAVNNIKTIASLSLEADLYQRYTQKLESTYKDTWRFMAASTVLLAMAYTLPFIIYAFAYWWGSYLIDRNEYSTTQYFIVLPALLFSAQTSGQMFSMAPDFSRAKMAAKQIFASFNKRVESGGQCQQLPAPCGRIEFCGVTFRYPSRNEYVVHDLSFVIEAGRRVAFVGRSGCGKTTLFSLLARFYTPVAGTILLDGLDITAYPLDELRRRIGYCPQEPSVFSGSVRFNLTLGTIQDPTEEQLKKACQEAQIWRFIETLPQGLDTTLGLGGVSVSGGQRQRLSLARAFLAREAPVLLLDEPTAALDAQNEKLVDAALRQGTQGRTCLQIAHRLGGIVDADEIFVFDGGRIAERGTHAALLSKGGLYADLASSMM